MAVDVGGRGSRWDGGEAVHLVASVIVAVWIDDEQTSSRLNL